MVRHCRYAQLHSKLIVNRLPKNLSIVSSLNCYKLKYASEKLVKDNKNFRGASKSSFASLCSVIFAPKLHYAGLPKGSERRKLPVFSAQQHQTGTVTGPNQGNLTLVTTTLTAPLMPSMTSVTPLDTQSVTSNDEITPNSVHEGQKNRETAVYIN